MNVLPRLDQLLGAPDGLPVTVDHLARLDPRYRDFVAGGNHIEYLDRHSVHAQLRSGRERNARDRDIVQRIQMNGRIFGSRQLGDFQQFHCPYLIKTNSVTCSPLACTCSLFPAEWIQNAVPSFGTGISAGPSTTTKVGFSASAVSSTLPMCTCAWHCVRRSSPLTASPQSSPHSDLALATVAVQSSRRAWEIISASECACGRGSASQRFGLRGLMSFRKKTAGLAG